MPIYNGIEYIEQSVSSIKNQSYTNWELIIGINGHPKDSDIFKTAKSYENEKIKVYDMIDVKGKSMALNKMLDYCNYDWISLLDVDDEWLQTKLEKQVPYMNGYDVIGTKCRYFGDMNHEASIPVNDISLFNFLNVNPIINSSCLLKKELCYWDEQSTVEDYDLWLRLWKDKKKFFNVNEVLIKHRIHNDSAFNSKGNDIEAKKLIEKYKNPTITLVTCYYIERSKFPVQTYLDWAKNLLSNVNHFNLVVFVNKYSQPYIEEIIDKSNNKIKLIVKEYEEFLTYSFKEKWIQNHSKNILKKHMDWKINMLYSEKINFVKETLEKKYFDTEFYGWCDIGYFRCNEENIPYQQIKNWGLSYNLNKTDIFYAQVCSDNELLTLRNQFLKTGVIEPIKGTLSIAGGFFVTYKNNLQGWWASYYNLLINYLNTNKLVKDDQVIILDCFFRHPTKFKLIKQKNGNYDKWFAFDTFLL